MTIVINIAVAFDRSLKEEFGNTAWVHWYREEDDTWTGYCWQKGKVTRGHRCPVRVGMENSTYGLSGTIVSIAPRYKGQGEWEWSTHMECDVEPLSDRLGAAS